MRSANEEYGGSGVILSTSKPSATPASVMSCLALARSNVGAGRAMAPGQSSGIQLPSAGAMPPISASLNALRSMARLTACRTRMSLSGLSGLSRAPSSSHIGPALTGANRSRESLRTASSSWPGIRFATSASPVCSSATRVASSATPRMTIVLTFGVLRQYSVNASKVTCVPGC